MIRNILGRTGLEVSAIAYGGIVSSAEEQHDSNRYVAWAIDQGINYFDVAPSYGDAELKLGESLKPYRSKVYLACKTTQRKAVDAQHEFEQSLKNLHTDYFDVYQLHSLSTVEDLETAFAPGGVMEFVLKAKEKGQIRKLGFSSHCEDVALQLLEKYDFDTVMFPLNWHLHLSEHIGERLSRKASERKMGIIGIKSLVERAWTSKDERNQSEYPKSWCKPIEEIQVEFGQAAMRYALSLGPQMLIPPGNFASFRFEVENIEACLNRPLGPEDMAILRVELEKVRGQSFFSLSGKML
jgi:aryl-alcohol dehydrogenase-like predicted oxidoreductase